MRVNFSITNQLATPSIHAAALANRPTAGQPGRLFVDTDSPSTGIYRDTGTAWILISSPSAPEADTLQAVTDRGNTTTNNIVLQYGNAEDANKINFYNTTLSESEYVIEKRGAGGTTNDVLTLEATGSNTNTGNPLGLYVDGGQENLITYYGPSYQGRGLRLNLGSEVYEIGDFNGTSDGTLIAASSTSRTVVLTAGGNNNATTLDIDDIAQTIRTLNGGDEKGLKLDFANNIFVIGDENLNFLRISNNSNTADIQCSSVSIGDIFALSNQITFTLDNVFNYIASQVGGTDIGLKLDFANNVYLLGRAGNLSDNFAKGVQVVDQYPTLQVIIGDRDGDNPGNLTYLDVNDGNQIINTYHQGNEKGLKLDLGNDNYLFGDYQSVTNGVYFQADNDIGIARIFSGGGYFNFEADAVTTRIGDIGGTNNGTTFGVDDQNETLSGTTNLLSGTAGGNSGQHLKIKIGTTQYKISLLNA